MMPSCVAYKCNSKRLRGTQKSFHRFPFKKPELLKEWIANINKGEAWYPSRNSVICSDHFEEKWFNRTGQIVQLREGAVPTLFYLSNQQHVIASKEVNLPGMGLTNPPANLKESVSAFGLQIVAKEASLPGICLVNPSDNLKDSLSAFRLQIVTEETSLPIMGLMNSPANLKESVQARDLPQDHTYNTSPNRLKRKLENELNKTETLRKKLRVLQRHTSRMQIKVRSMKNIINSLNNKKINT